MKDSTTSNSSNNANTEGASPALPTLSERRRSSAGGTGLFANLQTQKRDSTNPDMTARRASWDEQAVKGGMFSNWWNGYTRGSGGSPSGSGSGSGSGSK
jgi:hypothetical protein